MKHYGLKIPEGSDITNITVPSGTTFPSNDNAGELFFRTDENKLYIRNNTTWIYSLDADLLDGENGAYYLAAANITGTIDGGTL